MPRTKKVVNEKVNIIETKIRHVLKCFIICMNKQKLFITSINPILGSPKNVKYFDTRDPLF